MSTYRLWMLSDGKTMRYYCPGNKCYAILFASARDARDYCREYSLKGFSPSPILAEQAETACRESKDSGYVIMNRYGKIVNRWEVTP